MLARRTILIAGVVLVSACAQIPTADELVAPPPAVATREIAPAPAAVPSEPPPAALPETPPPRVATAPPPPRSVWTRVRSGFAMPDLDNALVREWENWYSSRPDYVARMVERSSRVLFHVVEEIERRKMPSEIALLPMIESAYNPQAYSRAHASGMWQFIPSTGKQYGLRQNWWYDGRRDILAATNAALDYLEKLHGMFGRWDLALASYNWGEGAVSRAMARNQAKGIATDYESLNMPAETRNYLPKLQAVKNIIANPERFGLRLADIPNEPYFATVTTPRHIDVQLAAKFAEIPIEEFRFLNPGHNKAVINANTAENIVLPRDKIAIFQRNLENHSKPLASWQAYTVKPGESAEKIAAKHGMSLTELKQLNGIANRKSIRTGQSLLVPVKAGAEPHMPDLPAPALAKTRTANTRYVPPSRRGAAAQKAAAAAKKPAPAKSAAKKSSPKPPQKNAKASPPKTAKPAPREKTDPPKASSSKQLALADR